VTDLDCAALIGSKGLKYLDRLSQFAIAASVLAIQDAGLSLEQQDADNRGIVLGTAFGGLTVQQEINRERVLQGPQWVSPMKFPCTPINALSYQIPIRYQMRLANVTLSCGMNSSLEAFRYATTLLRLHPGGILLCGGADELSFHAYHAGYFLGELAGGCGPEISCPFDQRRNGYILGEGCALMLMETLKEIQRRGQDGLAEVLGYGSCFAPAHADATTRISSFSNAMRMALRESGIEPDQIGFIAASANSSRESDLIEAQAIRRTFKESASEIPIAAIKSMTGEAFGASGAFQIAAAVLALVRGVLPPTIHFEQPDIDCPVTCTREVGKRADVHYAMVNSIDRYGAAASLVLGKIA
jgi:3-oxoacyl-[acyl-carrier-protein] synthase II